VIVRPVYVTEGHRHLTLGYTVVNVRPAHDWITRAAAGAVAAQAARGTLDERMAWDNWLHHLRGKMGEAGWRMHLGQRLDELIGVMSNGQDLNHGGRYVDVKTAGFGKTSITIQIPRLRKMGDLRRWSIYAAACPSADGLVTLIGKRPAQHLLDDYPVKDPAPGHQYQYIDIPFRDFVPVEVDA
jgi:hypothetical protein